MPDFEGHLLVGGMKLEHLQGELEQELPDGETSDWLFAGHVTLDAGDGEFIQLGRRYRLELVDGRAGQVVISRLAPGKAADLIAEFQPLNTPNKPR